MAEWAGGRCIRSPSKDLRVRSRWGRGKGRGRVMRVVMSPSASRVVEVAPRVAMA